MNEKSYYNIIIFKASQTQDCFSDIEVLGVGRNTYVYTYRRTSFLDKFFKKSLMVERRNRRYATSPILIFFQNAKDIMFIFNWRDHEKNNYATNWKNIFTL